MNCPSCGGAMRLEEDKEFLRCEFCKNIVFPEKNDDGVRVLVELSELACPGCAVPLVHAALQGWRMLYCGKCRGMLVSADIFVELILGPSRARPTPRTSCAGRTVRNATGKWTRTITPAPAM